MNRENKEIRDTHTSQWTDSSSLFAGSFGSSASTRSSVYDEFFSSAANLIKGRFFV